MFRVGIAGAGGIANSHARGLTAVDGAQLVAVYDVDAARSAELAAAYDTQVSATLDELIAGCDAVFVCAWTAAHREVVDRVAAAGRAVFCEKPLAPTLAQAQLMSEVVETAGVVNQVGLPLRWAPGFAVLRQLLADPANGRLLSATMHTEMAVRERALAGWRRDVSLAGGGVLLEVGFHDIDLLEWLVGPMESLAVTTSPGQYPGIEDAASVSIGFAGGAVGALVTVWHEAPGHGPARRLHIVCEHAQYLMDGPARLTVSGRGERQLDDAELSEMARQQSLPTDPHTAFVDAARAGKPATPNFADALRVHTLMDAAYRSAAERGAGVPV
ncbi:MAG TPA: Gfo/Idh/MocA family oxidoreductase [Mycobacteriales bacterium]|jgi:predicted dehydrogenase|nr:Gfo/Idh/MocA family oxidoreductase [Mycobacteriales bacterium]